MSRLEVELTLRSLIEARDRTIIHAAHQFDTSIATFQRLLALFECDEDGDEDGHEEREARQ